MKNQSNATKNRNRQSSTSVPDDVYGTMNEGSTPTSNMTEGKTFKAQRQIDTAGTTPVQRFENANYHYMDADPKQARKADKSR